GSTSKIHDIDADEDITLVNDQDDAEIFDVNDLQGEEVFVKKEVADKEVSAAGEVNAASIATTDTKIDFDHQLAKRLQAEEQQELTDEEKATLFLQLLEERRKFFAAKRSEEKRNIPPTQAQQRKIMCTYLKNVEGNKLKDLKNKSFDFIQKMFDRAFKGLKRAGEELTQENEEEVAIDAIPLAVKSSRIVDWKIYKERKKSYYQIIRADESSKIYMFFTQMLKSFDREDLEDLYN
nr:hypothetical protein [Tanacetum cinerariifolium]